jgi:hypothetical protein
MVEGFTTAGQPATPAPAPIMPIPSSQKRLPAKPGNTF